MAESKDVFDYVLVFTSTGFTDSYKYLNKLGIKNKILSSLNIDESIEKIMDKQKKFYLNKIDSKICIIFDDIMGTLNSYSKVLKRLLGSFRHYNISIIFVAQYASVIPTYIRELSFYNIIFNQTTFASLKSIYESYFRNFNSQKEFGGCFRNKLSLPYSFFFVDKINKRKFIAKAPTLSNL